MYFSGRGEKSDPGGVSQVIFHFEKRNGFVLRKLASSGAPGVLLATGSTHGLGGYVSGD